ncbi:MAG: 5'-nucleotidase [bacterium]
MHEYFKRCLVLLFVFAPGIVFSQQAPTPVTQNCAQTPCLDTTSACAGEKKARTTQVLIDETIPSDRVIEKLLAPYAGKVRALNVVIGRLVGELRKSGIGGGSLGNFVSDGLRSQASISLGRPIVVVVINAGGLRKNTIAAGELRASDIFELLPFENALVQVDLTGEQLSRLLGVVVDAEDVQSGAKIVYRTNGDKWKLVTATLRDEQGRETQIDPKATYTIVTIDYLMSLGSGGRYAILHEGQNAKPLGITMRNALMNYVKAETAAGRPVRAELDGRFVNMNPNVKPGSSPE